MTNRTYVLHRETASGLVFFVEVPPQFIDQFETTLLISACSPRYEVSARFDGEITWNVPTKVQCPFEFWRPEHFSVRRNGAIDSTKRLLAWAVEGWWDQLNETFRHYLLVEWRKRYDESKHGVSHNMKPLLEMLSDQGVDAANRLAAGDKL